MYWPQMTTAEKTHHIVHKGCIGFIRLMFAIAYSLLWLIAAAVAIFTVADLSKDWNIDIHPLIKNAIIAYVGFLLFKYTLVKPGSWIAGGEYDFFNPHHWAELFGKPQPLPPPPTRPADPADQLQLQIYEVYLANSPSEPTYPSTFKQCPACGTVNLPDARECGAGQWNGCGAPLPQSTEILQ